jgi:hypothetical protein
VILSLIPAGGGGELLQPVATNPNFVSTAKSNKNNKHGGIDTSTLDIDEITNGVADGLGSDETQNIEEASQHEGVDILNDTTATTMLEEMDQVLNSQAWNDIPLWPFSTKKDGVFLDDPPEHVTDKFRAIQADAFHVLHRIYVSTKHECHKAFYVAFREAVLCWNHNRMRLVEDRL